MLPALIHPGREWAPIIFWADSWICCRREPKGKGKEPFEVAFFWSDCATAQFAFSNCSDIGMGCPKWETKLPAGLRVAHLRVILIFTHANLILSDHCEQMWTFRHSRGPFHRAKAQTDPICGACAIVALQHHVRRRSQRCHFEDSDTTRRNASASSAYKSPKISTFSGAPSARRHVTAKCVYRRCQLVIWSCTLCVLRESLRRIEPLWWIP